MNKRRFALPLLILTTVIILVVIFKPALSDPNGILFSKSVDPLKSYFNFSYYLKFDEGIKHDGINYPYGDHLQYINSHPLYVTALKFVDQHIYPIANYGVGILNLSMIFSFLLGIPFLFLILRRFKLPPWYAFLSALVIGFLTPQFDRIHGHFEMVYWFFIPAFWYLLIRFREEEKTWIWGIILILSGIVGGLISAYYAAFYAIFIFGVLIADSWINRKNLSVFYKQGIVLFMIAVIPVLAVKGLVGLTDLVNDRPTNPYGFYVYHSNIPGVFFPDNYPFKDWINQYINLGFQWEGRAYIGLPASLLALTIILLAPISWFKKKKADWSFFFQHKEFVPYLISGTLILLFSMCFPFKWGFGFLLDLLPPIKQFRALGRFSWIFYYIFTIYASFIFYQVFQSLKMKNLKLVSILFLIVLFSFWGNDTYNNIQRGTKNLVNTNDKLANNSVSFLSHFSDSGIDYQQYQAIFSLPFANTNGDKLLFEDGQTAFGEAMKYSYHTGLPLVQSFSPRLSFSQSLSTIQLLADPAIRKTRLDDMNDNPLLLVCTKEEMTVQEKWLQSQASVFWEDEYITLSTLPVSVFKTNHDNWLSNISEWRIQFEKNEPISSDMNLQSIFYNGFEGQKAENVFSGSGALYARRGEIELFNGEFPIDTGSIDLSFWLFFDTRQYDMPQPILKVWDKQDKLLSEEKLNNRQVHDIYGSWIRISTQFEAHQDYRYQLLIKGKRITADDLLIKPMGSNVLIKLSEGKELYNNFPID